MESEGLNLGIGALFVPVISGNSNGLCSCHYVPSCCNLLCSLMGGKMVVMGLPGSGRLEWISVGGPFLVP